VHGGRTHSHFASKLSHSDWPVKVASKPDKTGGDTLNIATIRNHAAQYTALFTEQQLIEDLAPHKRRKNRYLCGLRE
jgi:hypothetical protein